MSGKVPDWFPDTVIEWVVVLVLVTILLTAADEMWFRDESFFDLCMANLGKLGDAPGKLGRGLKGAP